MEADEAIRRIYDHMWVHNIGEYPHIQLAEALNMAIAALCEWQKTKLPDGFEYVSVQVSKELAPLLRPYRGCPRGALGMPGAYPGDTSKSNLLRHAKDFLVRGADETFVCVPKMWYDECVRMLDGRTKPALTEGTE